MNTYDYNENFQTEDTLSGMNTAQAKKAPNIFMQLIYSVMPGKYGELANVKVKGFIFYYLFWCLVMCTLAFASSAYLGGIKEKINCLKIFGAFLVCITFIPFCVSSV